MTGHGGAGRRPRDAPKELPVARCLGTSGVETSCAAEEGEKRMPAFWRVPGGQEDGAWLAPREGWSRTPTGLHPALPRPPGSKE